MAVHNSALDKECLVLSLLNHQPVAADLNRLATACPKVVTAAKIAPEMKPSMIAYSVAVAPLSCPTGRQHKEIRGVRRRFKRIPENRRPTFFMIAVSRSRDN